MKLNNKSQFESSTVLNTPKKELQKQSENSIKNSNCVKQTKSSKPNKQVRGIELFGRNDYSVDNTISSNNYVLKPNIKEVKIEGKSVLGDTNYKAFPVFETSNEGDILNHQLDRKMINQRAKIDTS